MSGIRVGETRAGFRAQQLLTLGENRPVGMRFEHARTGLQVIITQVDALPQTAFLFTTPSVSDRGEAHTCEHLLLLKGNTAQKFKNAVSANLGSDSALTYPFRTFYGASVEGGASALRDLISAQFQAFLRPDFLDVDAQREAFEFGVERLPDGTLRLAEKGTIYNEMKDSERRYGYYYRALELLFGKKHPYTRVSGGEASHVRRTTVQGLRDFHRRNYRLDRGTLVMVSVPESIPISEVLESLGREVDHHLQTLWASGSRRLKFDERSFPRDFSRIAPEIVSYPSDVDRESSSAFLVWPVLRNLSQEDRLFLEVFLNLLSARQGNPMSRIFFEGSRWSSLPKIASLSLSVSEDFPALYPQMFLSGIDSEEITIESLERIRRAAVVAFRRIAALSPRSPEFADLVNLFEADLLQARRRWVEEMELPPNFGERRPEANLLLRLDQLKDMGPLVDASHSTMVEAVIQKLRRGENVFTELIRRTGLERLPLITAERPSSQLRAQMEASTKLRWQRKIRSLRQIYQARTDQEALARLEKDESERQAIARKRDAEMASRPITDRPPMSRQLGVSLNELPAVSGVHVLAAGFSSWSKRLAEVAFDLNGLEDDELLYVPLLPRMLSEVGVRINGEQKSVAHTKQEMKKRGASVNFYFSTFGSQNRHFLRLRVEGGSDEEFEASAQFARNFIQHSNLTLQNLEVIRGEVQNAIAGLEKITSEPEEFWVSQPFVALARQDSPIFVSINSPFTKLHALHRLHWRIKSFSSEVERRHTIVSAEKMIEEIEGLDRAGLERYINARAEKDDLLKYIAERHIEAPPHLAGRKMCDLLRALIVDVGIGPGRTLEDVRKLSAKILSRARAQALVAGQSDSLAKVSAELSEILGSLSEGEARPFAPDAQGVIARNLLARGEVFNQEQGPRHFGLVIEDLKNATVEVDAGIPGFRQTDRDSILDSLSAHLVTGQGPNGFFSQTLAQGLAYSNGLGVSRERERITYYAERNGSVAATMSFIEGIWRRIDQIPEDELVDVVLKSYFHFSSAGWDRRSRTLGAANLVWNQEATEEQLEEYSRRVLALSRDPDFLKELKSRAPRTISRILIGQSPPESNSTFLITGSENHMTEVEERFPGVRVQRLWRSDFWLK